MLLVLYSTHYIQFSQSSLGCQCWDLNAQDVRNPSNSVLELPVKGTLRETNTLSCEKSSSSEAICKNKPRIGDFSGNQFSTS